MSTHTYECRSSEDPPELARPMMRYAAIDIETTGLDPERCQVLELACVVETDWRTPVENLPTFRALVNPGEIRGEPVALMMNARLIRELAVASKLTADLHGQIIDLSGFLAKHFGNESVTIAGKNFGAFDFQFLRRSECWEAVRHKHRFIDAGGMWWNPLEDTCLPDLATCQKRAGLAVRPGHDAVQDCYAVIECVRAFHKRYKALPGEAA